MKELIKNFIPPYLLGILRLIKNYPYLSGRLLSANRSKQNKCEGEVIVLGNGPSALNISENLLKKIPIVVMNDFHKSSLSKQFIPVAYCVGESVNSKAFVNPNEFLESGIPTNYWFPVEYKKYFNNPSDNINYYSSVIEPVIWHDKRIDLSKPTLGIQTTAQIAIQVAIFLGYKKIYLLGFDHDWLAKPDFSRHFYSADKQDNDVLEMMSYYEIITYLQRMWEIYYCIQKSSPNVEIINISKGSYLDVFQSENIDEFNKTK